MFKSRRQPENTEQTIKELKLSIDSIEKMIQKSQQILKNTRPLQPREVRSDSIQLRFNSKSKSKSKEVTKGKLNQTNATTHDGTLNSSIERISKKPQKTKPHLFIDTDVINQRDESKSNILIHEAHSPVVSAIDHKNQENFIDSSSFAESLESHFNLGRRFKTEAMNDSWEYRTLDEGSLERKKQNQEPEKRQRRIILKKKRDHHFRNISELQQYKSKPKRKIFDQKVQPGKYSYFHTNLTKNQIKSGLEKSRENNIKVATLSSARQSCLRHQKDNEQMGLEEFLKKVKQYGFVERYLTRAEISCIYEYLKKSSIPQYKWPLYVVDEVYEKMQSPKNTKM